MSDILQSLLGGVSTVGSYLDKGTGGRALRGLAAGRPRELASILPFSDTTGLTDPHDEASGRDVTDIWGLTKRGSNDFGSNALGFGADMLLNPLALAGGVSAFRAAPTAIKGLGAAAKSVTGLDALEHAGGGIRGLLMGEEGAAKIPRIPPNPIDVEKFDKTHLAANATRPRRYSVDPARQQFYANDRKSRFGARFGSGQRPDYSRPPGDLGVLDRVKSFLTDEGGWLRLPERPLSEGAARNLWEKGIMKDYVQALGDESTPAGKLQTLGRNVGVNIAGEHTNPFMLASTSPDARAMYKPNLQMIVPNLTTNPETWLDMDNLREWMGWSKDLATRQMSTDSPMHPIVHELAHGIHHQQSPTRDPYFFQKFIEQNSPRFDRYRGYIGNNLSKQGRTNPAEFIAELFARNEIGKAQGIAPPSGILPNLYETLQGPGSPSLPFFGKNLTRFIQ